MNIEEEWESLPTEKYIFYLTIATITKSFDEFVGECMEDGEPKAPAKKSLMRARGYLPAWCKNTLVKS